MVVRHEAYRSLANGDTEDGLSFSAIVILPCRPLVGGLACCCRPFPPRVPAVGMVVLSLSMRVRVRRPACLRRGELRRALPQPLPDLGPEFLVRRCAHHRTDMT